VYADPGPYLAFSHGDPAPSNNHLSHDRARLVDFEYAGYRHALYDLTAWYVLCPLPDAWTAAMELVFRQSAGSDLPAAALSDDRQFRVAKATMCAYRALAMLTWFPTDLLIDDRAWTPGWSQREALLSTTLRLQRLCAGISALEPLADLGGAMAEKLGARWPELGAGELHWPGVTG
jgi:thiamine kinase-like enzyme